MVDDDKLFSKYSEMQRDLMSTLRLKDILFHALRDRQSQCLSLDENAGSHEITELFLGDPSDFEAPIRPERQQARCAEQLQGKSDRLPANTKACRKRVLAQDRTWRDLAATYLVGKLIGDAIGKVRIHGSKVHRPSLVVKPAHVLACCTLGCNREMTSRCRVGGATSRGAYRRAS